MARPTNILRVVALQLVKELEPVLMQTGFTMVVGPTSRNGIKIRFSTQRSEVQRFAARISAAAEIEVWERRDLSKPYSPTVVKERIQIADPGSFEKARRTFTRLLYRDARMFVGRSFNASMRGVLEAVGDYSKLTVPAVAFNAGGTVVTVKKGEVVIFQGSTHPKDVLHAALAWLGK